MSPAAKESSRIWSSISLLLLGWFLSKSAKKSSENEPKNPAVGECETSASRSIVVSIERLPPPTPNSESRENRKERRENRNLRIQRAIALFAFIYAGVSVLQWRAQITALRIDQRAWVGITEVGITPDIKEGDVGLNVIAVNSGKTPAFNMYQTGGWKLIPSDQFFDCVVELGLHKSQRQGVLHPNARRLLTPDPPAIINDFQANTIISKTQSFYVFGKITYDDAFKEHHETTFCMRLKTNPPAFVTYSDYNDAN